jgi:hypothetical protein
VYNLPDHNANCTCKIFQAEGIPCRYILCVLKGKIFNEIPSKHIVNRWTKFANRTPIFDIADNVLEEDSKLIFDVWNRLYSCVEKAGKDKEKLLLVLNGAVNMEK